MSIESEILRIQHNVANTYAAVAEKGGDVPLQPNSENLAAAVSSIPAGGTNFTPDDTLNLSNGVLGVTTPVQGILSQAEFDALPNAQKSNGLYVIPGEGGGSGGGVTSFNGRSGAVMPQAGDYTAADIGAATIDQVNTAIQNSLTEYTSDGWYVRKYASGYIEMLKNLTVTAESSAWATWGTGLFYIDHICPRQNLPVALVNKYFESCELLNNSGWGAFTLRSGNDSSSILKSTTHSYMAVRGTKPTVNAIHTYGLFVAGTWK